MLEVLNDGVRTREEEGLVPGVLPAHEVGRSTVRAPHLQNLGVHPVLADAMSLDDEPISDLCLHVLLLFGRPLEEHVDAGVRPFM
jgi:hypothetical protein